MWPVPDYHSVHDGIQLTHYPLTATHEVTRAISVRLSTTIYTENISTLDLDALH